MLSSSITGLATEGALLPLHQLSNANFLTSVPNAMHHSSIN